VAYLKYYDDERERWAALKGRVGQAEARLGVQLLARQFGLSLKYVAIKFTRGRRHSKGGRHVIILNLDWAGWRTIAHEVAHTYQASKLKTFTRWHCKQHRKLTDRFCAWLVEQGWHQGALAHEVALAEIEREKREHEDRKAAATPPPIEHRIERREAQVRRLETRIKALTTRLKTARRSLSALQRVKAKQERSEP
jgi:hypothetical protein